MAPWDQLSPLQPLHRGLERVLCERRQCSSVAESHWLLAKRSETLASGKDPRRAAPFNRMTPPALTATRLGTVRLR